MLATGGKNKQIVRHIYHTTESNLFPMEEEEFSEITDKMKEFLRILEVYAQKLDFSGFFRKKTKSGAVKCFYGTIKCKINKKCQYFLN